MSLVYQYAVRFINKCMACIFITQYFELMNGAKTLTQIVFAVHFSSKAIKIWSTYPEKIRISDAQNAKKNFPKDCICYFGVGSKSVSNSSLVFTSSLFSNG